MRPAVRVLGALAAAILLALLAAGPVGAFELNGGRSLDFTALGPVVALTSFASTRRNSP